MKEPELKRRVKAWLKGRGAWFYMPVPGGYGKHGVPDFLCMVDELAFAIETKTTGRKPTLLQEREMKDMRGAGWLVYVVDSEEAMTKMVNEIEEELSDE